jgi:hypothetical protein
VPEPPSESEWPTRDGTFAGPSAVTPPEPVPQAAPPPEPYGPPLPDDRRIGAGMLLALGAIGLAAVGILAAYLLTHRGPDKGTTTTVVLSTVQKPTTAAIASPLTRPATTATTTSTSTASTATTTAQTTITPQTPAAAPPPQPATATVPDVSGTTEQSAASAFNKANVLASFAFVPSSDPLGTVEQQAKPAGTTVPYHAHVQVNVSEGPNAATEESVPNTIGQTLSQAVATLNAAQLRLIYVKVPVTSRPQAGKIVQQTPLAGGKAPQNAQILVFLGAFRAG